MTAGGRSRRLHDVARALRLGSLVFVAVAALGQLIALAVFVARGADGSLAEHAGIGWLYVGAFHGVPLEVVPVEPGVVVATRVTVALLLPTAVAVWLSFAAGRVAARDAVGGAAWRVVVSTVVALPYAVASLVLSLVVSVRLDVAVTETLFGGAVDVTLDPVGTLVGTFAFAFLPAATGGVAAVRRPDLRVVRQLSAVVAGGAQAFGFALLLGFAGLLVNAGADPLAARTYFAAVSEPSPAGTAMLVGHHVLALPNQSMWVLAPAMGGADELRFAGSEQTLVSYGATLTEIDGEVPSAGHQAPAVTTEPLPRWYLLFLLVPAAATVLGGARAAQVARSLPGALALGTMAGIVFAALVLAGSVLSTIAWRASVTAGDSLSVAAGPDAARAAALALAWGVAGGLVGALWRWSVSSTWPTGPAGSAGS